jgi:hypothetical protein
MMTARIYGAFTKVAPQPDGSVLVSGIASSEAEDADGETITAAAMKAALPGYLRFPALREMHQAVAAGKVLAATVGRDGKTYIECRVVDPVAVTKVRAGVYRGFSIGGHVAPDGRDRTNPKVIRRLSLTEISLVDRPSNPEATFQLVKIGDPKPERPPEQPSIGMGNPIARDLNAPRCHDCGEVLTCAACADKRAALAAGKPLADGGPGDVKAAVTAAILTKLAADKDGALRKWIVAVRERDDLHKVAADRLAKLTRLTAERDSLAKRCEIAEDELQRRPKGGLKAVPIGKGEDTGLPVREAEHDADDAIGLIRKAHTRPMPMRLRSE